MRASGTLWVVVAPLLPMPMQGEQQRANTGGVYSDAALSTTPKPKYRSQGRARSSHETASGRRRWVSPNTEPALKPVTYLVQHQAKSLSHAGSGAIPRIRKPARPGIVQKKGHKPSGEDSEKNNLGVKGNESLVARRISKREKI